ncbi:MAG: hypothetical protein QNJ71_06770 [Acidimicrobiia bacterium]|nr:hypothetical protein [Acidimicrobiia bacterium]
MADEPFLLKDMLTRETVTSLAGWVGSAYPTFDEAAFVADVFDAEWPDRELKQRTRHITVMLAGHLPDDYRTALAILVEAAQVGEPGWEAMSFSDFVEVYGLDDPDASIPALAEFTKLASAEFAVRPFILEYPDRMYAQHLAWTGDPDWRVRRLASEGCRPRLPWGMALKPLQEDPTPILPVLDALRNDESEDVRRSVANNLNDIAKDHPGLVVEVLHGWQDGEAETEALTKHALRTLLKKGDVGALRLVGLDPDVDVEVIGLTIDPACPEVDGDARVSFGVRSAEAVPVRVMVDLAVWYLRANGSHSAKVFKLRTADVDPGQSIDISRKITFKQLSTRTVYPGPHAVEVQVNGPVRARLDFEVTPAPA